MGKKPSAETQLKQLKTEHLQLQRRMNEYTSWNAQLRNQLADAEHRFNECDHERRKLLEAMCAHVKREPAPPVAAIEGSSTFKRWTFKPRRDGYTPIIAAVKGVRNAMNLGLAEAKVFVERGEGWLTPEACEAMSQHVEFT